MGTWSVTPNDGVTGSGPSFNFPRNTGNSSIVYTIKYTDDNGCTGSTTYTVGTGCASRAVTINYHVLFDNLEKGGVETTLRYPGGARNITAPPSGPTSESGSTSGTIIIQSSSSVTEIADAMSWDIINTQAKVVHNTITFYLTYSSGLDKFVRPLTEAECDTWSGAVPERITCDGVQCRLCAGYSEDIEERGAQDTIEAYLRIGIRDRE